MPHSSRRPRASSDRYSRGGERSTKRRGPSAAKQPRAPRPRRVEPHSELDLALDAAAATPQPTATTFAELGLDARLVRALAARDINEPFAIQARALPDALAGRDVLGRAQTGSGKTLAFGLPLLTRLAATADRRRDKAPRGLVLVPTRELAQQVADALAPLGRSVGVSITTVYGGVSISRQIARVRDADVVVATPGRLIDLLERRACTLSDIQVTVLDEADHMADLGFMPAVTRILDETPAGGQRMFFSATLDRGVGQLVTTYISDPALHAVTSSTDSGPAEHRVLVLSAQDKVPVAAEIAGRRGARCSSSAPSTARTGWRNSCRGPASMPRPSMATATRTSGSGPWMPSPPGIPASWSPPTSRPGASTWTTLTWWCSSTRRTTIRITCTARAGRPAPGNPAWSSRWWNAARSVSFSGCTTRRASPRPAMRSPPDTTWSGRSPRQAHPSRRRRRPGSPQVACRARAAARGAAAARPGPRAAPVTVSAAVPPSRRAGLSARTAPSTTRGLPKEPGPPGLQIIWSPGLPPAARGEHPGGQFSCYQATNSQGAGLRAACPPRPGRARFLATEECSCRPLHVSRRPPPRWGPDLATSGSRCPTPPSAC